MKGEKAITLDTVIEVNKINKGPGPYSRKAANQANRKEKPCFRCGNAWSYGHQKRCSANGTIYSKCNFPGHFASDCKNDNNNGD